MLALIWIGVLFYDCYFEALAQQKSTIKIIKHTQKFVETNSGAIKCWIKMWKTKTHVAYAHFSLPCSGRYPAAIFFFCTNSHLHRHNHSGEEKMGDETKSSREVEDECAWTVNGWQTKIGGVKFKLFMIEFQNWLCYLLILVWLMMMMIREKLLTSLPTFGISLLFFFSSFAFNYRHSVNSHISHFDEWFLYIQMH